MPRRKRWEEKVTGKGSGEFRLISWKYFTDFVYQQMLDYEKYIWRGHQCDNWELEPTLDRLVKKAKIAKSKQADFRAKHLENFKYAVRGRRGSNPPPIDSENEWWALGQHHGLATPLLDWTTSPFVAAYFSFIGDGDKQTRHRAIYALHRPTIELLGTGSIAEQELERREARKAGNLLAAPEHRHVEFIKPLSDENQRLVNQGGLFSRSPDGVSLDRWVEDNDNDTGYTLIKILIPNKDRGNCLKTLNRMNINHLTLFPDLYGASKFCNLFGEIEKY